MMKHFVLPFILFLLLVSEGIALDLLPASLTSSDTLIVPHWVFLFYFLSAYFMIRMTHFILFFMVLFSVY